MQGRVDEQPTLTTTLTDAIVRSGLPIVAAYLFGSAARGEAGPMSDIDVAVLFDQAIGVEQRLAAAAHLHTLLEPVSARPVQVVILNDAAPLLTHRVLRDDVVLVGQDDPRRVQFEAAALREYLDVQWMLETYDRAVIARAKEGRLGA